MEYEVRIKHLLWLVPIAIVILAFTTGWEYGFMASCERGTLKAWQGLVRFAVAIFATIAIAVSGFYMIDEGPPEFVSRTLNKKVFNFNLPTSTRHEDWQEFQEWKKENSLKYRKYD